MKKLYFIRANKSKHGGAENYLAHLLNELKRMNIKHEVKYSTVPKFMASWLRITLFNIQVCLTKKDKFYFSLERITCPDIYRAGDGVHKVFMKIEKKSILNPLNLVYLYIEKKIFKNAKKIIANSKMIKNQIIDIYNIDPKKIKVIYNGIHLKQMADFLDIKKEFGIKNEKILLYVGSGFKRKGVKEFLEIVARLDYHNYKAFIVGKEKKMNFYKKLAKDLNIREKVIFTGPRSDVDKFYSMSDIFIFPTHYEPFSNVVLEAMSFKNAIFTTKQNGVSEILYEESTMQTPDDFSVTQKIEQLLQNPVKLQKIKEKNHKLVQNFTIEKNAKKTMEIINEYLH